MYHNRRLVQRINKVYKLLTRKIIITIKKQLIWLLRTFSVPKRRRETANAGFVLPTVVMVSLVVVLLTTAIIFRSFDRSKNASNVRVNEAVLQANGPALERAKAKISNLFSDPTLPRAIPSNSTLYNTLISKLNVYTLGDETAVTLAYNINNNDKFESSISTSVLENQELLKTAWKFPVDTDNNGKFDSFTLYGIYFRNPLQNGVNPSRKRSPLDARTPPMLPARAGTSCDISGDTSASLVGNSGWYKLPTGELKKSFYVYSVTVPITDKSSLDSSISANYETYKGNRGFSAIELQQDRTQLPITNNAVVYEDDLEITPGPVLRLNGRIFTNSNLLTKQSRDPITLFQVSSIHSCYYARENGQIVVGGNVAGGGAIDPSDAGGTQVDLFNETSTPSRQTLSSSNKSTSNVPNQVAYNSQAYAQRIDLLVNAQFLNATSTDPQEVQNNITLKLIQDPSLDRDTVRKTELKSYFRKRTRRVPFNEVPYGQNGATTYTTANVLQGMGDSLRPPDAWVYPIDSNTQLTLNTSQLPAIDPDILKSSPVVEQEFGDRILVGNNLPQLRWDNSSKFLGENDTQDIAGQTWKNSSKTRTRTTKVQQLADLGATGRDGFWEDSAATSRSNTQDVVGGLRLITGAGVYRSTGSFLPAPPPAIDNPKTSQKEDQAPVVWSDAMPMLVPDPNNFSNPQSRGHLVMRATAVYHYNKDAYNPQNTTPDYYQTPIACVSSYYNPTNQTTVTTNTYNPRDSSTAAASNNGLTYTTSMTKAQDITRGIAVNANGLFTTAANADDVTNSSVDLLERLKYQANLVFPNGRLVNSLLAKALAKATTTPLTLSEQSAIDSTICALQIADGTLTRDSSVIPDGAIQETAFLDARQIKSIDKDSPPTGKYDLQIEQRQPLEIRATRIDLNALRIKLISGTWPDEYLLPNSGIIYATRDDAQPDSSDPNSTDVSASDYKLDPDRRPNAIMLINGSNLSRQNSYRPEEKGLILATNLPVYVQGDFNLHTKQEFKNPDYLNSPSDWDSKFYTRAAANRDPDFACRPNDPRLPNCTVGETWRPAAVIADAVTLLSSNFQTGYRNEGDYDLRNNQGNNAIMKRSINGFSDNNFVTSSTKVDDAYYSAGSANGDDPTKNSSYLNNFVTPIQRRANFPEYVMEMCFKLPVSECGAGDWYVGYNGNGDSTITDAERTVMSVNLPNNADVNKLVAGTTAKPPTAGYERYARRVAFKRNNIGQLVDTSNNVPANLTGFKPIALGIIKNVVDTSGVVPDKSNQALWYATTSDSADPPVNTSKINYNNTSRLLYSFPSGADPTYQPLLEPIIQLQATNSTPTDTSDYSGNNNSLTNSATLVLNTRWLSRAKATTFNLVIATGDTPSRVGNTTNSTYEINGGLQNFPRFLENWDGVDTNINGSFIQFQRSIYATAPFQALVRPSPGGTPMAYSIFNRVLNNTTGGNPTPGYTTNSTTKGEAPFYMAPNRNWGFDVALLAQNPDLFAQRFVVPATDPPNEYYREVSRDDWWVKTLLCAVQDTSTNNGFTSKTITIDNTATQFKFALPDTEHPSTCPVIPN